MSNTNRGRQFGGNQPGWIWELLGSRGPDVASQRVCTNNQGGKEHQYPGTEWEKPTRKDELYQLGGEGVNPGREIPGPSDLRVLSDPGKNRPIKKQLVGGTPVLHGIGKTAHAQMAVKRRAWCQRGGRGGSERDCTQKNDWG